MCLGSWFPIDHVSANRLVRSRGNRELGRAGKSSDVGATRAVDGNGVRSSRRGVAEDASANISGVDQLRARRVQLGNKPVYPFVVFTAWMAPCSGKSVD